MHRCPRCDGEPDEILEAGDPANPTLSLYCDTCRLVYEPNPRLIDVPERTRRDLD